MIHWIGRFTNIKYAGIINFNVIHFRKYLIDKTILKRKWIVCLPSIKQCTRSLYRCLCSHPYILECHIRLSVVRRYGNLFNYIFTGDKIYWQNVVLVVGWKQKVTRFIHRRAHVESSCQRVPVNNLTRRPALFGYRKS